MEIDREYNMFIHMRFRPTEITWVQILLKPPGYILEQRCLVWMFRPPMSSMENKTVVKLNIQSFTHLAERFSDKK